MRVDEQEVQTTTPAVEAGGFFAVCRTADMAYWSEAGWVKDHRMAEHYWGAPTDDFDRAERDRDRLKAEGTPCFVYFVPEPRSRRTFANFPLPADRSPAVGV